MIFKKLENETTYEMNQRIGKLWKDKKIFEKSIKTLYRSKNLFWSFLLFKIKNINSILVEMSILVCIFQWKFKHYSFIF